MRVNVYAEEMTEKIEIIQKEIDGQVFTGLRIYLELPATVDGKKITRDRLCIDQETTILVP